MLFSFGLVLPAGFLFVWWVCSLPFSGNVQKVQLHKKHDGKTSRRVGVGSAAKRLEEPNFSLGAWDFCSTGLVRWAFIAGDEVW